MADFSKQINEFHTLGTFDYVFGENDNVIINSSSADFSKNYLSIPLSMFVYDDSNISKFNDPTFVEFVSQPALSQSQVQATNDQVQQQLIDTQAENQSLKTQLDSLITQTNSAPTSATETLATKQVVIELRKQLGQGTKDSDFSDSFPYTPLVFTQLSKQ